MLGLTIVVLVFVVDDYLSPRFVSRSLLAISITALVAAGEALVIITRNIDLSVGSMVGVSAYLTAELLADHRGLPSWLAIVVSIGIGATLGLFNGVLVALRQGAVDHRHAGHAVDLPQRPHEPRRGQDDQHGRAAPVARRPSS